MEAFRLAPARAPAAYLLAGAVAGLFAASGEARWPAAPLLGGALAFSILCLLPSLLRGDRLWAPCFLLAATAAFWAYGEQRLPHPPEPRELLAPIREQTLDLKILRIYRDPDPYGRATGIAKLTDSPPVGPLRAGDRIYFAADRPPDEPSPFETGAVVRTTGLLEVLRPAAGDAPGRNFEEYLRDIGVHYRFARTGATARIAPPGPFERFCYRSKDRLTELLDQGAPEGQGVERVYKAMMLGEKAELLPAQKDRFRLSGTMHFFAISGLHIGVIAGVIAQALLLLRVPRSIRPLLGLPLVYLYVEVTGGAPSAMRAFLMTAFFWVGIGLQRQRSSFAALVASAVAVLIWDPLQLFSAGFQLSYAVVASILLFGLPLHGYLSNRLQPYRWLPPESWDWRHRSVRRAVELGSILFSVSLAAWVASAPLSAAFFGILSPGAVWINMLLVHIAALAIVSGVLAITLGLIGLGLLTAFVNHAAWLLIALMESIVDLGLQLPATSIQDAHFPLSAAYLSLALFYAWLAWLQRRRGRAQGPLLLASPLAVLLPLVFGLLGAAG